MINAFATTSLAYVNKAASKANRNASKPQMGPILERGQPSPGAPVSEEEKT